MWFSGAFLTISSNIFAMSSNTKKAKLQGTRVAQPALCCRTPCSSSSVDGCIMFFSGSANLRQVNQGRQESERKILQDAAAAATVTATAV